MSFTRRLTLSFVAILVLSLGSVLVQVWGNDTRRRNVWLLQNVINTQAEVNDFSQQLYAAHRKILIVDALRESGERGRINQAERSELLRSIDELFERERKLNRDLRRYMPEGTYQLLGAAPLLQSWKSNLNDPAAPVLEADQGRFNALARRLSMNELSLLNRSDEINAQLKEIVSLTNKVALGVFLVALITTFVLGYYMTRYTRRAIRKLQRGTAEWGSGNFDYTIEPMGRDEFGQLAESFNDMASNLRRAMSRVREASRRADAANQAKSGFLANMSHELRTPMNAIIGYSEMLMEEIDDDGDMPAGQLRGDVEKIERAGKHLLVLINDVLDISKIEAGRMSLFWEDCDLATVLRDVEATTAPLMDKNGNTLERHFQLGDRPVRTDITRFRQIMLNLLSNAAKFTHNGTVDLTVTVWQDGDRKGLRAEVADTGIGMSEEQLDRVFDAFVQADLSTTKQYGGSGLGLTISRKFAELLGGRITASSREGQGSRFVLELPLSGEDSSDSSELSHSSDVQGRVLVVDDDPAILDIARRVLSREGFQVSSALSGEEGLRLARQSVPDLIILDVMMPGMDGWQVLNALRSDILLRDVPVLMQSMLNERDLGLLLGANEYLVKPVQREELTSAVRDLLPARGTGNLLLLEQGQLLGAAIARLPGSDHWQVYHTADVSQARKWLVDLPWQLIVVGPHADDSGIANLLSELRTSQWRSVPVLLARDEQDAKTLEEHLSLYLRQIKR